MKASVFILLVAFYFAITIAQKIELNEIPWAKNSQETFINKKNRENLELQDYEESEEDREPDFNSYLIEYASRMTDLGKQELSAKTNAELIEIIIEKLIERKESDPKEAELAQQHIDYFQDIRERP